MLQKAMQINHTIAEFVQEIMLLAIEKNASDIHFEPQPHILKIRFRIDGILYDIHHSSTITAPMLTNYLKIQANLDIAEKRLPQDGRYPIKNKLNKNYICRVSTLPILHGEKVVLRLLKNDGNILSIEHLGLEPEQKIIFQKNIDKPQGLILITGPTGSGKTTTLYTALSLLNSNERNITTIEDPIEIELENINQLNVNPKIGLNFNHALRAILRQDPDIIMVGEIRDRETAKMAIHAAQTGHLVLSTLHTNNSVESLTRLTMMGISSLDLVESLNLIIAQRLARKCCKHCKTTMENIGCQYCILGYHGRTGIYELFEMNETTKMLLLNGAPPNKIAKEIHLSTLWENGLSKVNAGIITQNELQRSIGEK